MANLSAIFHAGDSLATYLRLKYADDLGAALPCEFAFMGTGAFHADVPTTTTLTLLLYSIGINEHSRHASRPVPPAANSVPLGVDLYLLMTAWAERTQDEHTIMGWAMRQLYLTPILDRSILNDAGQWHPYDTIQILPTETRWDELTRLWEALRQPYRLSMTYTARVVMIDVPPAGPDFAPVVATRFTHTSHPNAGVTP